MSCCDQNRLKILSVTRITSDAMAKQWLSSNGAIQAAMEVDSDFFDYSGGVYSPDYGDYVGGHCVSIIGYDDVQGCWICKNSWGTEWGDPNDPGWFKIAYGVCGIFRAYAAYGYSLSVQCRLFQRQAKPESRSTQPDRLRPTSWLKALSSARRTDSSP